MSLFLRLLSEDDKAAALLEVCGQQRTGVSDARVFEVPSQAFDSVPGKPFAYWVSEAVRKAFESSPALQNEERIAAIGASTKDDGRFLRLNWEITGNSEEYPAFAKGGRYSPFYADIHLVIRWRNDGIEPKTFVSDYRASRGWSPHWKAELHNPHCYFRPGLTWPRRTNGLSFRVMPRGCIFADKGPAAFVADDAPDALLTLCTLLNSQAFGLLVSVQLARVELAQSFEVGLIQQTPVPDLSAAQQSKLATLARRAWSLKRTLDTIEETSHAFVLPAALRVRLGNYHPPTIEAELARIQSEIDDIAFDLYGFNEADRASVQGTQGVANDAEDSADDEGDDEDSAAPIDQTAGLLSWALGVAFGRFDWRLATGERAAPPEPDPFDPLPAKSPGMLPDGAAPYHAHAGILVDDAGHPHDLARLVEEVLARVEAPVLEDVRRWLQRDFFAFHLQRYSKSRRKAPIYWPLSTTSGSYTLWVYYPSLTSQTLYTAINDFVEPKLKEVSDAAAQLRNKGASRSRVEEKQFEELQAFELELIELRDTLLKLAPTYKPNHDDGVQICAAPLWPLFRHKPWQKVLKDTWSKLEKGEFDWAHLAMNYWPDRVREKCKTDKSLAIAHGVEDLYIEPPAKPKTARGRKKKGG
ncbi:type II restriction endonuclease subunit M [Pseudoxanthomonas suwonensis]|uniref:type II restriction endonuclease subunit M n=1 Tax=Pseudoxanthomonas suwonensis TaxID=314722 RepID=UPI00138F0B74|nr:type II restriction endonuclease subunit M [Pseudoxanthomonas suwonensis]KAF1700264.1 type II restriction endonuclease subunit M [Pseudoxanthomonas suwonensis]